MKAQGIKGKETDKTREEIKQVKTAQGQCKESCNGTPSSSPKLLHFVLESSTYKMDARRIANDILALITPLLHCSSSPI